MSYQSPIDVIIGQMRASCENGIYKAVQNAGVNVDKNELLKALQYDRGQYQKGYMDRDSEIVRCKDCKYGEHMCQPWSDIVCTQNRATHIPDWFCADGERKEN